MKGTAAPVVMGNPDTEMDRSHRQNPGGGNLDCPHDAGVTAFTPSAPDAEIRPSDGDRKALSPYTLSQCAPMLIKGGFNRDDKVKSHTGEAEGVAVFRCGIVSRGHAQRTECRRAGARSVMRMTPVAEIGIPAKGKASLQPNGLHIMMFGLKTRPAAGDTINVTLRLDDGTSVPVAATVRKQEAKHAPTYGLSCRFWRSKLSSGGVTSPAGWRRFRTYRRQRPAL